VEPLAGRLVVATHELIDRTFRRAVVLLLAHDDHEGTAGVVLNRPSGADLPDRLQQWAALAAPPAMIFAGGPVGRDTVIGLGSADGDIDVAGSQQIADGISVVDLSADAMMAVGRLRSVRLFAGYAGWDGGQLEGEIAAGAWFVVDARPDDPLTASPAGLWRAVLARQGGVFTTVPDDPGLN
jgi:putative transcriptional regulator